MKLFGSFKLTDRIRVGASTGGKKKSSKGIGCGSIFLVLCIICIPISLIRSCVNGDEEETTEPTTVVSDSGIEAFDFNRDEFEFEVGEDDRSYVKVEGTEDFSIDDIVFVSSDESVVTFEYDSTSLDTYLYFNITAVSPGTATVHVETADGKIKSEEIPVTVLEEETTTEAETTTEKETTTKAETTTERKTTAEKETTTKAEPITQKSNSRTVYRTPSGKRYHYDSQCGGKNSYSVSLDEAKNSGLTPCQKCAQ